MTAIIAGVIFGLILLFLVGQALWGPLRWLLQICLRCICGGVALFLIDLLVGHWGFSLGVNPASAITVGVLGFPGLLLLGALKVFFV